MSNYILGIDIGTQGTKAILFDVYMNIISSAFEQSKLISPTPGTVWQEADDIYFSCVRTIKDIIEKSKIKPEEIAAIGIDSQMAGIMGIDSKCEAVTVYDSWLDMRCEKYVDAMSNEAGDRITQITGGPVTYTHGPKILWWMNEHPDTYKKIYKFVLPHAYVVGKMTGLRGEDIYFDYTCLQYSGFGDNKNKVWSKELIDAFGVNKDKMARIVSPFEVVGKTTKSFAHMSGLVEGIPVVAGAGDTSASIFGAGIFEKDMLLDCAGTASVLCSVVEEFIPDTEYKTMTMMRSPIDGLWMPLAYINGGGLCLRWFKDEVVGGMVSYDELSKKAKDIPLGSEGIVFIPHFAGRVLPNNPYVKGSFIGLDWKHKKEHMFRSIMEGISYEYSYYLSILEKLYPNSNFNQLYVMGGGAKSSLFNSIKADVLGVDVIPFEMSDTALIGSAVIAGVGVGVYSDYKSPIKKILKEGETIHSNMKNHQVYQPFSKTYLETIDCLTKIYKSSIYNISK